MTALSLEKILATAKSKSDAIKQKAKTVKFKAGANRFVLLPGWRKGEEHVFFHDFANHYIKNLDGDLQAVYLCLNKTHGKPCPVCNAIAQAAASVSDDDQIKALKEAGSRQSYLLNVLMLDGETPNEPVILEVGKTVFGSILDLMEDWGAAIFDPENPQVINVNREGSGFNTKYSVQISAKKHAINSAAVYAKLNDLDEYVRQENEENMQRAIGAVKGVVGLLPSTSDAAQAAPRDVVAIETAAPTHTISRSTDPEINLNSELDDLLGDLEEAG